MWEPVYSIDNKFTSRYGDEKHDLADVWGGVAQGDNDIEFE